MYKPFVSLHPIFMALALGLAPLAAVAQEGGHEHHQHHQAAE